MPVIKDLKPFWRKHIFSARVTCVIFLLISPVFIFWVIWMSLKDEIIEVVKDYAKEAWDGAFGKYI